MSRLSAKWDSRRSCCNQCLIAQSMIFRSNFCQSLTRRTALELIDVTNAFAVHPCCSSLYASCVIVYRIQGSGLFGAITVAVWNPVPLKTAKQSFLVRGVRKHCPMLECGISTGHLLDVRKQMLSEYDIATVCCIYWWWNCLFYRALKN